MAEARTRQTRQRPWSWHVVVVGVPLGSKKEGAHSWPAAAGGRAAPGGLPAAASDARAGAAGGAAAGGDGSAPTWLAATRPACTRAAGAACEAQRRGTPAWLVPSGTLGAGWCVRASHKHVQTDKAVGICPFP